MLNVSYLEELEDYMASGAMEKDLSASRGFKREEMLRFIEKIQDLAELTGDLRDKFDSSGLIHSKRSTVFQGITGAVNM